MQYLIACLLKILLVQTADVILTIAGLLALEIYFSIFVKKMRITLAHYFHLNFKIQFLKLAMEISRATFPIKIMYSLKEFKKSSTITSLIKLSTQEDQNNKTGRNNR